LSRVKVIVNPAAGAGRTARKWPHILELIKNAGLRFEHVLTEAPGHAVELACDAVNKGFEHVISVGGDGTINEVVNGLYNGGDISEIKLGIVSTGTGSDFIRTIGLPRNYVEMCRCLTNNRSLTIDLGIVEYTNGGSTEKRVFVNFAGLGFDAEIVRRTTQQYKSLGSLGSYLMGLMSTLVSFRNRKVSMAVDGNKVEKEICTVIMNNGRYGGGGMLTAPHADPADGQFDVLTIGNVSKADLLWSLPRIYRGTHLTHPKVAMVRAVEIEINSEQPTYIQADGELLGKLPAKFRVLPAALNIVV